MTINADPVIGKLGALEFRWYGVIMALSVAIALWVISRELRRRRIPSHHVLGIAIFGVPFGIIGARLVHVFDNFGYYLDNPGKIFGGQLVGLAIYGVVAGGLFGIFIYCKWKKLPVLRVIDCLALAFPVGQIVGKCANIINGDTWGAPTTSAWNFTYVNPKAFIPEELLGVPTHPTPMYEQIWLLIMVGLLLWLMPRLMKVNGLSILTYAWLYSLGRFVISFWRENDPMLWGLKEAQVIALAVLVLAPVLGWWMIHRARKRPTGRPVPLKPAVAAATATGKGSPATGAPPRGSSKTSGSKKDGSSKGGAAKPKGAAGKAGGAKAGTAKGAPKGGAPKSGGKKAPPKKRSKRS